MAQATMKEDALPQIYFVRDTDLGMFAYELHILAGDFLRESEFNLHSLAANTGPDSIAIMGKNHMWLSDALLAYCPSAELYRMAAMTEYPAARAFLFHTERKEDGRLYGDVLMMDLDTLRQDIDMVNIVSSRFRHGPKTEERAVDDAMLKVISEKYITLPLYLMDHSGLAMQTTSFNDPWDSGQVGWIYVSKEDALKEFGGEKMTGAIRKKAEDLMRSEVAAYP